MRHTYWSAKAKGKPELVGTKRTVISGRYELEDIVNHNSDIKKLMQVGDYVNGKEVYLENGELAVELAEHMPPYELLKDIEIKSIVTKEQFASVEYIF